MLGDETSDIAVSAATELFLQRDKLTGEGKAMLAIAMHHLGFEQEKQRVLVSELPSDFSTISFNPETFASGDAHRSTLRMGATSCRAGEGWRGDP